jgi:hypothetical protein
MPEYPHRVRRYSFPRSGEGRKGSGQDFSGIRVDGQAPHHVAAMSSGAGAGHLLIRRRNSTRSHTATGAIGALAAFNLDMLG